MVIFPNVFQNGTFTLHSKNHFYLMQQKIFFLSAAMTLLLAACGGTEMKNPEEVGSREDQTVVTGGPVGDLKANAIQHDDAYGQARWGLGILQTAYNESKETVDLIGDVTILLDSTFALSIKNKVDGDVHEQRVNLTHLNPSLKSFEWIVNNGDNPHPGVKVPVLNGKSGVELYVDGEKNGTADYLEIILADRSMVQRSVSGLTNAIRVARGEALGE